MRTRDQKSGMHKRMSKESREIYEKKMALADIPTMDALKKRSKEERLNKEYPEMRKVVDFFYANCPCELSEFEKQLIESQIFTGTGTKSKKGIIDFLANFIGYRWYEWKWLAKKEFNINY